VMAALHEAGWLIACMPQASDWTIGLSARSAQYANEAYRLTDRNYFSDLPPELADTPLYEAPDASANFVLSLYLSQREKLEQIRVKGGERTEFYASHASDQQSGPSLADMLRSYVQDSRRAFSDFPLPARPVYDTLAELQLVSEYPTLLVIDNFDAFDRMATSCNWQQKTPLHASQLLVPSLLHDLPTYGGGMANGVMLCAMSVGGARAPRTPLALRNRFPPPYDYRRPQALPAEMRPTLRKVKPYGRVETQRCLEYYALVGHLNNPALEAQLRTGELAVKAHMLTAGHADDLYKLCDNLL